MKNKVLIVDDNKDLVAIVQRQLEQKGFEVQAAYDGQEALNYIHEKDPDLMLLDINLPKKGGLDVYKEITTKHGRPRFPVLIISGQTELKETFEDIQADGFFCKPYEIESLINEVDHIIQKNNEPSVILIDHRSGPHVDEVIQALNYERYKVLMVDGAQALEKALSHFQPSYIFMEYMQSGIQGHDCIREVRKLLSDRTNGKLPAQIIVYTFSGMDFEQKSLEAGADRYLSKPSGGDDFIQIIREFEILHSQS